MLIAVVNGYSEVPEEYEAESIRHIDYEQDDMPIELEGSNKVKRTLSRSGKTSEVKENSGKEFDEDNQTPAEDRNWQVKPKPKVKRMSKSGKKIHIYLKKEEPKTKGQKQSASSTTTASSSSTVEKAAESETQTRRTPELTTKSDNIRHIKYSDKDSIAAGSHTRAAVAAKDSSSDATEHHEHVVKEKIKIKHHHHHHHHNHVKTVVKKEPYPVEKVVHVPFEKIVEKFIEKKVPYKVEVPVEKIVEKVKNIRNMLQNKPKHNS